MVRSHTHAGKDAATAGSNSNSTRSRRPIDVTNDAHSPRDYVEGQATTARKAASMFQLVKFACALAGMSVLGTAPALAVTTAAVDNGRSINAVGDGKFFIGDCTGKAVRLSGDRQTIVLLGKCKSVVSQGSYKHITLDGSSLLRIQGDGNTIKWKVKPDSVNALGHKNLLTNA